MRFTTKLTLKYIVTNYYEFHEGYEHVVITENNQAEFPGKDSVRR